MRAQAEIIADERQCSPFQAPHYSLVDLIVMVSSGKEPWKQMLL